MLLNESAISPAEALIADAARHRVALQVIGGVRVVDCGVEAAGGNDAGLAMARAAMAGRGVVGLHPAEAYGSEWADCPWPVV